jgi:hypothetical protein
MALAIAVPLTRDALAAAIARGGETSFAAQFAAVSRTGGLDAAWRAYEPEATLAAAVVNDAEAAGITVVPDVTLARWLELLATFRTVTLVAHWRSSAFEAADLLDLDALWRDVADEGSPLWRCLREFDDRLEQPDGYDAAALAGWLTAALVPDVEDDGRRDEVHLVEIEREMYRRRCALEAACPGVFGGGAAIEFSDGFQRVDEIVGGLRADLRALVDLTVCNSVLLGEEIRRKCRHCVVMVNGGAASLSFRLALYRQAIWLMKQIRRSYPDSMMRLRQYLADEHREGGVPAATGRV